jgi:hypothetical protein
MNRVTIRVASLEEVQRNMDEALRAVAKATLSRCARLKPPSEVLIL